MISKLVVKGEDRTAALRVLRKALDEFEVVGLNTNIDFLKRLASNSSFICGDVDTGFIKVLEPINLFFSLKIQLNYLHFIAAL